MREFIIDFTADVPIVPGTVIGRQGENNATALKIKIPDEILNNEAVELISLAAQIGAGHVARSELIAKAETVTVKLDSRMTAVNSLSVQLEGYDTAKSLLVKSAKLDNLIFDKSVTGEAPEIESNAGVIADIAANTSARHTHENAETLNKFGDSNGSLTYDGKAVGGLVLKSKYYSNDFTNGIVDAGVGSYDAFLGILEPLPDNAIIYDIGIWYEKTDGEAKEYKDIELYTLELISSAGSFEIFANPIFDSGLLQRYGVGRINDTGAGILLNSIKSYDGKVKGFTVYYIDA